MPVDQTRFREGHERFSIENEIVHFLHDNQERAYNVQEITEEVIDVGWSEANVDTADFEDFVGCAMDLSTVNSILDHLVDNGQIHRRILDVGEGERSYYKAPA